MQVGAGNERMVDSCTIAPKKGLTRDLLPEQEKPIGLTELRCTQRALADRYIYMYVYIYIYIYVYIYIYIYIYKYRSIDLSLSLYTNICRSGVST